MLKRVVDEVNVFIGTAGSGHALVGPQMPHGMVKLGPDTISLPCGGYDYNDPKIIGFSHTHLEGVGGRGGRGNISLTATTRELIVDEKKYASRFSHDKETAEVGYYQVLLQDYNVNVELTASKHVGFHRYTFPRSDKAQILVDIGHTLGSWNNCRDGNIQIVDDTTIQGYGVYPISNPKSNPFTVYFYIKFDKAFSLHGIWLGDDIMPDASKGQGTKIGAYARYHTSEGEQIQVKVGISYISIEQAQYNLEKEIPHWDFNKVRVKNREAWEKLLGRVKVEGGSDEQRVQFYSALYRSLNQPTDYTEYEWYHSGYSGKSEIHPTDGHDFYGDDWAIWDTFRTTHPLQAIIEPERQNDMAETFVRIYEHGGWLPMATAPNLGYNQVMIGHNAASVIAGIYDRGFRNFNIHKAYEAMRKTAMEQHEDSRLKRLGTPKLYTELGYYPGGDEETEEDTFSVSITMELVYADWCTAQMAKAVGNMKEYEYFMDRAYSYRNLFDPRVGFMRRKHRNGAWVEPFNPADSFKNGFCECSSWEYTFFVPHDIQGLVNLIGGREAFAKKLDDFFAGGHYNYQNETSIQVPFLYNYVGAPWKTQKVVRYYINNKYRLKPDGLFGEDDAGAMSAWYVFAVLGIYPVCPGHGVYVLSSPVFEKVVIDTGYGNAFTIMADNVSEKNMYIQQASLNGEPLYKPWITHQGIIKGGVLQFKMGPEPNMEWGSRPEAIPPSMTSEIPEFEYSDMNVPSKQIRSDEDFTVSVVIRNQGAIGGETVKIYANDKCISSKVVFLQAGETKKFEFDCRLYNPGSYTIRIDDLTSEVVLVDSKPAIFKYQDNIYLSDYMIPYGCDKWIYAYGYVKNIGSMDGCEQVVLYIDGKETQRKSIELMPGDEKKVSFRFKLTHPGNYSIKIGSSTEKVLDVAVEPDEKWRTFSTTRAEYYQAGEHLYISAAGYQSRPEFGVLYLNKKIGGDFDVITKIAMEDNTSPYAPAGIMIKNDIKYHEILDGYVVLGAMSKRGYFFNCHTSIENYYKSPKYAVDCPEVPYWFKLEKRGNVFAGYYSKDGVKWILLNRAKVPNAHSSQHIGLFVNSASPEMRMVKFEYFTVERRLL